MSLATSVNPVVVPLTGGDLGLADQGSYHIAIESTPGVTGIVGPVSTTLDETKGLLSVYNSGSLNIYPRFLRLHVFTIGTGGTRVHFTVAIDNAPQRYSTGGSTLTVNNTNMAVASYSGAQVNFGALTLSAASASRRFVGNKTFKATTIETVEDCYQLSWAGPGQMEDPASLSTTAAATSNIAYAWPSLAIGPGQNFVVHQWRASITVGITFGVEFGFVAK